MNAVLASVLPGIAGVCTVWLCYDMLTKKNKSIFQCILMILAVSLVFGLFGIL